VKDQAIRALLMAIRRSASNHRLYGEAHEMTVAGMDDIVDATNLLLEGSEKSLISVVDDTLYLDRAPMASLSVAFNGMIRELQAAGIESLLLTPPVTRDDAFALVRFLNGGLKAPDGAISCDSGVWARTELLSSPSDGLRQAYTSSLVALRSLGEAVQAGTRVELTQATLAVTNLLEQVIAQPEAGLLLTTVKSHHEYTFYHSVNTSIMAIGLGRLIGLEGNDLLVLGLGSLLHDIGKIGVPAAILQHPGRLDPEGWREIKRHPLIGAEMILAATAPEHHDAAVIAFEHHAGYDGRGYPTIPDHHGHIHDHAPSDRSKAGERLHLFSRLTAVVDTYDAITTRRSYRRAEKPSRALHALMTGAGRSHDPDVVQTFIGMVGIYPPGSRLLLDDGRIVTVIRSAEGAEDRPTAAVLSNADGTRLDEPELIELDPDHVADQVATDGNGNDLATLLDLLTLT